MAPASAVLLRGLAAAPVLLLGLDVLIAALFPGQAAMLVSLILASGIVAIAGRPESAIAFSRWTSAVDIVCVAGVLTVLVQFIVTRLERSLEQSAEALHRLRSEQALRERAQEELTRAQATLQQTQKLDAVGRLAGGIAHDFNNTLQVVLGWTELRIETASRASCWRSAGRSCRRRHAWSSQSSCRRSCNRIGGSFRTTSRSPLTTQDRAILIDEGHLNQVLLNIVLNARDAMPTGGSRSLTATHRRREALPPHIGGLGQEPRLRAVLHHQRHTGNRPGSLDRLPRRPAQAHGAIDVRSEPGKGTTVTLFFPALTATTDPRSTAPAFAPRVSGRVVIREHGGEFTVLITDGIMPGGNTRQLIDDFLLSRPAGRVIVCSGYFDSELSLRDLNARTFDFVPKPFSPSELVSRLDSLVAASGVFVPPDVTHRLH